MQESARRSGLGRALVEAARRARARARLQADRARRERGQRAGARAVRGVRLPDRAEAARADALHRQAAVRSDDLYTLPPDLPVPEDDGAADHLPGSRLPAVSLPATDGADVTLAELPGRSVVFAYPRTGRPGEQSLGGDEAWNAIPGARGCTPQACAIRDTHAQFEALGARVFGLSTQSTDDQREAADAPPSPLPAPLRPGCRARPADVRGRGRHALQAPHADRARRASSSRRSTRCSHPMRAAEQALAALA